MWSCLRCNANLARIIHEFPIYSRHFYLYKGVYDVLRN